MTFLRSITIALLGKFGTNRNPVSEKADMNPQGILRQEDGQIEKEDSKLGRSREASRRHDELSGGIGTRKG